MRLRSYESSLDLDRSLGGAGDIITTPTTVRTYIEEISANYRALTGSIAKSMLTTQKEHLEFVEAWALHAAAFFAFATDAQTNVDWTNAGSYKDQADRWYEQYRGWVKRFTDLGGVPMPQPPPPGQGLPDPSILEGLTKIAAILGGVAALFVIMRELK